MCACIPVSWRSSPWQGLFDQIPVMGDASGDGLVQELWCVS